jgi:hypothetical protein
MTEKLQTRVARDVLLQLHVAINVAGSFLLGMLVVAHWASPQTRAAIGVGFLAASRLFPPGQPRRFSTPRQGSCCVPQS